MADDVVVFNKADLPLMAYPLYEDIRRRGKLCDVTLKVIVYVLGAGSHRPVLPLVGLL